MEDELVMTKQEKQKFFNQLLNYSLPGINFYLMLTISSVVVTLGLLINSPTVIIGGMLIAPILYPILSLSMGVVVSDYKLIRTAAWVIMQAILIMICISILISFAMVDRQINESIMAPSENAMLYFIIAFASGVAATYAASHPRVSDVLPGVSIAVSLIPPLSVFGIGISFFSWSLIINSTVIFGLNLLGMIFAAIIVFSLFNFHDIKKVITAKVKKVEKKKEEQIQVKKTEELTKDIVKIQRTLKEASEMLKEETKKNKKLKKNK